MKVAHGRERGRSMRKKHPKIKYIVLLALILSSGLLLDGPFVGALSITASVAVGTMIICVLCMKKQKKLRRPKSTYR